ncbi:MAG: lipid A biosynthesis [Rhodomicrobium sp.]|nr:lipid A biosynthesis [Rhodomicrobium sp.]
MNFSNLALWWANISTTELIWLAVGFGAQAMFSMRFIIQWIASEKARRSVVPETFWYFSFAGGLMLFIYAIYRMDPVFILGQGSGLFIYARNIYFIIRSKRETAAAIVQDGFKPAAE